MPKETLAHSAAAEEEDWDEEDWELLLFFNAAETTFTLPLFVKEEADLPMVFVENNDVDDAAPPKEDEAEAGCANARRRS